MRPRALVLVTIAASATATLLVTWVPQVRFAYRSPELHIALESVEGVAALLVAALLFGRYLRDHYARHLATATGFLLLGLTNLALSVTPSVVTGGRETAIGTWGAATARLAGAALLAAGALSGSTSVRAPRRAAWVAGIGVVVSAAVIAVTVEALGGRLPNAVDVSIDLSEARRPQLDGHPGVLAVQAIGALLFLGAAVGFLRRAEETDDAFYAWLSVGAVLAGFARANYFLFPSLYSQYVYTGDIFRLGSYVVCVIGGTTELVTYWRAAAAAAVAEDRRRMARDLHDGLAQELAFIVRKTSEWPDEERLRPVASAAARALDESRAAISALTRPVADSVDAVVDQAAREVLARLGADVHVELRLDDDVDVPPAARDAFDRIVREAVSNAVRHGGASRIRLELTGSPALLRIWDDGKGFDVAAPPPPGSYGLQSMRERAAAAEGTLDVRSSSTDGTTVEVMLP